jgi:hypothetical protein
MFKKNGNTYSFIVCVFIFFLIAFLLRPTEATTNNVFAAQSIVATPALQPVPTLFPTTTPVPVQTEAKSSTVPLPATSSNNGLLVFCVFCVALAGLMRGIRSNSQTEEENV